MVTGVSSALSGTEYSVNGRETSGRVVVVSASSVVVSVTSGSGRRVDKESRKGNKVYKVLVDMAKLKSWRKVGRDVVIDEYDIGRNGDSVVDGVVW